MLVMLDRRNHIVRFSTTPSSPSDKAALTAAVKAAFSDVLSEEQEFVLQMKSEDWGKVLLWNCCKTRLFQTRQ